MTFLKFCFLYVQDMICQGHLLNFAVHGKMADKFVFSLLCLILKVNLDDGTFFKIANVEPAKASAQQILKANFFHILSITILLLYNLRNVSTTKNQNNFHNIECM